MIITLRFLRITLHLAQRVLTDAETFITLSLHASNCLRQRPVSTADRYKRSNLKRKYRRSISPRPLTGKKR